MHRTLFATLALLALAAPALAGKIRAALGPWAFSGVAGDIARGALGDAGWIEAMRARLGDAADRLDGVLREVDAPAAADIRRETKPSQSRRH
ncbi:MAG: hypothetical protein IH805_09310 [Proteobacteria bacterium]|nr:hypothetical protein [Pseudomonadota bacterium]